ncbi:hypothetical protein RUM44_008747 [Polyplax serrata]|uniref:Uncharacterized protein n=1 Tax=Polyplax serrata TaxID=468196 RepID=A0ABR1B949_POLSC
MEEKQLEGCDLQSVLSYGTFGAKRRALPSPVPLLGEEKQKLQKIKGEMKKRWNDGRK